MVGPDESSLPAASIASDRTTLSGPRNCQPLAWAFNACKLPPGWISHDTLASPPSTIAFKAPPPSVMATGSKHPPPKVPAHPLVSRPDIPRTVPGILPATAGFAAKASRQLRSLLDGQDQRGSRHHIRKPSLLLQNSHRLLHIPMQLVL